MPVTPTYPGIYIEEIASGVRTIVGVSTSVAAFVDGFKRGPVNRAVRVFNFGDFAREFGGLDARSEASYGIQQFFLNGGSEAWVVRVVTTGDGAAANNARAASVTLSNDVGGGAVLALAAANEGAWGNNLRARVDVKGCVANEFNLALSEVETVGGRTTIVRQETFRNLSMNSTKTNYVQKVLNDANTGSRLASVASTTGANPPLSNGTFSGLHIDGAGEPQNPTIPANAALQVRKNADGWITVRLNLSAAAHPLTAIAPVLEAAIHSAGPADPVFAGATVSVVGNQLLIMPGGTASATTMSFQADGANALAANLKLDAAAFKVNVLEYTFGSGVVAGSAQIAGGIAGQDGLPPGSAAIIGEQNAKMGIYALEDVDLFNILCIPRSAQVSGNNALSADQASALITVAEAYCEKRRAFFVMDTPGNVSDPVAIANWLNANDALRHRNAALYFPRVSIPDPLDGFRLRSVGASGTVAGIYARTDGARGVWKAPAGTEATTRNVPELGDVLTDAENGALNPIAVNCLRSFPIFGNVVWGSRTLEGTDQQASEWKYVPVRRLALFLEESLYRGLKWVVFEPNDEPLWAQIRLNAGAFMHNLFVQGAFQGTTPREAYFVKCDKETTTQNDRSLGIVNIIVGFAPLKPAEFVIIKIQQIAGQIET